MPMILTRDDKIKLLTVVFIENRSKNTRLNLILKVINMYKQKIFTPKMLKADNEFEDLTQDLSKPENDFDTNISSRNEHVMDIKRPIRTIKERWREYNARLPYKKKPKIIVRAIGYHCVKWLNNFSVQGGIPNISPRKVITGIDVRYGKDCQLEVGKYVQAHEYPDHTNQPELYRSVGAIALGTSENEQGGYYFMSLKTGKKFIAIIGRPYRSLKK